MITILLKQIIDLLTGWISSFTQYASDVLEKLGLIEEDTSYLPDIKSNTDDIKDNTAAVITPINNIKSNTDAINTSSATTASNTTAIMNQAVTIGTNSGRAAAFAEDCANNTLDIKDKVVTIASDTTQIRANTGYTSDDVSDIKDLLRAFAGVMTATENISGAICNFDTDISENLVAYDFAFMSTQAGTPAPADPQSISGVTQISVNRTGKNMLPNELTSQTLNGTTITINGDKSITVSGTPSIQTRFLIKSGVFFTVKDACKFSFGTIPTGCRFYCSRNSGGTVTYPTLTDGYNLATNGDIFSNMQLEINTNYDGTAFTVYPMIEFGTTVTTYEKYNGDNYTISLGSTYYGGSAIKTADNDYSIISKYGKYNLTGTENWQVVGTGTEIRAFIDNLSNKKYNASSLCNRFVLGSAENVGEFDCKGNYLRFNISGIATDKASFNTWIANNPTYIIYELAAPSETSIVAPNIKTLKGINNIWCDTGDSDVTYKETLQHKIDKGV